VIALVPLVDVGEAGIERGQLVDAGGDLFLVAAVEDRGVPSNP